MKSAASMKPFHDLTRALPLPAQWPRTTAAQRHDGLRGLVTVRSILGNIGVCVVPDQVCIPKAHEAFDSNGHLKDERQAKKIAALANSLVEFTRKMKG